MAILVKVKNPFEPANGREVISVSEGQQLSDIINNAKLPATDVVITVNAEVVEDREIIVKPNDFIVISPIVAGGDSGAKQVLGMVAMVALSVVTYGTGGWVATWTQTWGSALLASVAGAAVMFAGSMLVNRIFGARADLGSYGSYGSYENNATYSWSGVETMEGQNNAIAITYGTVMSGGQSISKFVNLSGDSEYLNWLVSAGEGPLYVSNIRLNDNEISYYEGISLETREGRNNQSAIPNFNDTYATKALGYELTGNQRVESVMGNATQGIRVKIEFSNGLYYANDSGGLDSAWVSVVGYYRTVGSSNWIAFLGGKSIIGDTNKGAISGVYIRDYNVPSGTYRLQYDDDYKRNIHITYPDGSIISTETSGQATVEVGHFNVSVNLNYWRGVDFTFSVIDGCLISGAQSSAIRREFRVDYLAAGTYEVMLFVTGRSHATNNSRAQVRCWWTELTSIVYDDFTYPNICLIGIRAKATDQLNGSPSLTFLKTRPSIYVWNPYSNSYIEVASNNPAWAAYDMLHQASLLQSVQGNWQYDVRGVPAKYLIFDQFNEWAAFCDSRGFRINIEINSMGEMLEVINNNIAPVGRGRVVRFGTRYGCIWDCAKSPVQMFGMGNIIAGSFKEEFLQTSDRANCVELTYVDANHDYNRETVTIYSDTYDSDAEEKTAQATFNGITSYEQAYREGMYQLYSNKYLLRTISFEASIDAISCTIGDVVLVAHDVPMWAKSGRIKSVEGQNLILPVELDDTSKSYRIMYRTVNDNIYTSNAEILQNKDGWCIIKVLTPFNAADPPQENDIFDLAVKNIGSKPFVVKNITRAQDFTRKLECIEYDERVYNENYNIPVIEYTEKPAEVQDVSNLSATINKSLLSDGTIRYGLSMSWVRTSRGSYNIYSSSNNVDYTLIATEIESTSYQGVVEADTKYVKVITVSSNKRSAGVVVQAVAIDMISALNINNLTVTVTINNKSADIVAEWEPVTNNAFRYYLIEFEGEKYQITENTYSIHIDDIMDYIGEHEVKVTAYGTTGAGNPATATVTLELEDSTEGGADGSDNV